MLVVKKHRRLLCEESPTVELSCEGRPGRDTTSSVVQYYARSHARLETIILFAVRLIRLKNNAHSFMHLAVSLCRCVVLKKEKMKKNATKKHGDAFTDGDIPTTLHNVKL